MRVKVYSVSGPAWQPVKDGKPYNKWVGTIQFSDVERVMFGKRYYMIVAMNSKEAVEHVPDKYMIGEIVTVSDDKLTSPRI